VAAVDTATGALAPITPEPIGPRGGTGPDGGGETAALSPAPPADGDALVPAGAGGRKRGLSRLLWVVIAVVVSMAFAAGSGLLRSGGTKTPSLYQHTLQVAGEYRCPVCAGESVADSEAPEAVEIRDLIQRWLKEGRSQAYIRSRMLADYGESILEKPPASGLTTLVWVLPGVAVGLSTVGLALAFTRWRRAGVIGDPEPGAPELLAGTPDLDAVIAPASPPPGAPSNIGSPQTGQIERGQIERGQIERGQIERGQIETGPSGAPLARPRRRRYQRVTLVAGIALMIAAGALWFVDRSSSPQLPGETITGGATGITAELGQASALAGTDPAAALVLYEQVLYADPGQPIALTAAAWIYAEAGFATKSMGLLNEAERSDPGYGLAHLYRGLVLLDDEERPAAAAAELKWYVAHDAGSTLEATAKKALAAAEAAAR
jgi:cytochrome c-type biogenesis protein CcmH